MSKRTTARRGIPTPDPYLTALAADPAVRATLQCTVESLIHDLYAGFRQPITDELLADLRTLSLIAGALRHLEQSAGKDGAP